MDADDVDNIQEEIEREHKRIIDEKNKEIKTLKEIVKKLTAERDKARMELRN